MKKVFDPQAKHHLALGEETIGGKHSSKMFLIVGQQVCSRLRRDFGPLLCKEELAKISKIQR